MAVILAPMLGVSLAASLLGKVGERCTWNVSSRDTDVTDGPNIGV